MKRSDIIKRLIGEGLTHQTLSNFTDKQLIVLSKRMLSEQPTTSTKKGIVVPKETPDAVNVLKRVQNAVGKSVPATIAETKKKKKPTKPQLDALDKNKNGKIDKEDFKLLRSKKKSSKEEDMTEGKKSEKWIQKAIHPSKKGSLKKALGVKKDETIPTTKLKSAAKKGGKTGQRARLAMTLKKLKETEEIKNWLQNIVETEYHPFTSKGEIMEIIKKKINEQPEPDIAEPEVLPDVEPGINPDYDPDQDPYVDPFEPTEPLKNPNPKMRHKGEDSLPDSLTINSLKRLK